MVRALILLISFFVTIGCQTTARYPNRGSENFKIEYNYEDSPEQKKILLYFRNVSKRAVCFGPEDWPQNGILLNTGDEVSLEVNGRRYFLGIEQDYCPRCNKKVSPGEEIQGFFYYKSFELKREDEQSEKKLFFSPVGSSCR
jgi:hypothetical protein